MIQLNPMQESAFASHMAHLIPDYATGHVRNGRWTEEESLCPQAVPKHGLRRNQCHDA